MDYFSLIGSFGSGVLLTLLASYINQVIKNKTEQKERINAAEYELYLKLNELYQWYFWLATNEFHKKETDDEIVSKCHEIAREIATKLHQNEASEFTHDLLRIIYDESMLTYNERWKAMDLLSEKMGAKLTPVHNSYIQKLNDSNVNLMARNDFVSKAPASSRFRMRV